MNFKINHIKQVYRGFLNIIQAEVTYDSFTDGVQISTQREMMERGDSVAILLYEQDTECLILTSQFRFPTALKDQGEGHPDAGWILELPAGGLHPGEDPKKAAIREVEEELGYHLGDVTWISSFYVSPGGTSERIHLYYAEVITSDRKSAGGGLDTEDEDIRLVKLPVVQALQFIRDGQLHDAKTIIAIQWFKMRKFNS